MSTTDTSTTFTKVFIAFCTLVANPLGLIFLLFCAAFVRALGMGLGFWG